MPEIACAIADSHLTLPLRGSLPLRPGGGEGRGEVGRRASIREADVSRVRDREELTRVGPGTVMGEFLRQYWIPAALSSELAVDGDPMRLLLLGEKLIAFRDSAGRV